LHSMKKIEFLWLKARPFITLNQATQYIDISGMVMWLSFDGQEREWTKQTAPLTQKYFHDNPRYLNKVALSEKCLLWRSARGMTKWWLAHKKSKCDSSLIIREPNLISSPSLAGYTRFEYKSSRIWTPVEFVEMTCSMKSESSQWIDRDFHKMVSASSFWGSWSTSNHLFSDQITFDPRNDSFANHRFHFHNVAFHEKVPPHVIFS
jgi:hypothetical protein